MPKERLQITRDSSFEEFYSFIKLWFNEETVAEFKPKNPTQFDHQTLLKFLEGNLVQEYLERLWDYERGPTWVDRSTELAITETTTHGLGSLIREAELALAKRKGRLKDFDRGELNQIQDKAVFIDSYFRWLIEPFEAETEF